MVQTDRNDTVVSIPRVRRSAWQAQWIGQLKEAARRTPRCGSVVRDEGLFGAGGHFWGRFGRASASNKSSPTKAEDSSDEATVS
jgi:hypothetical protein